MKLRDCDCGSDIIYIDPRDGYVVFCHTCDTCTMQYTKVGGMLLRHGMQGLWKKRLDNS